MVALTRHNRPSRMPAVRLFAALVVGVLLVQAAWVLVVPPFRGLDEHDHAYKAAAVARGDWHPHHTPSDEGWGELVAVPGDLVSAAHPICDSLHYTTPDNCSAVKDLGDGQVTVASSAARYNPVFYFIVGSAAIPFTGAHALYAMRVAAALLCALMMGLAGLVTWKWARTKWPLLALLVAATPTVIYSTAIAAPNGIELASAMLVWSSLLGLSKTGEESPAARPFIIAATVGAVPLTTVRTLGPLWLVLISVTVMLLFRRQHLMRLLRRKDSILAGATIAIAMSLAVIWSLAASTNVPETGAVGVPGSPWKILPESWLLWILQSIAAFPARDDMAPPALYALALLAWWLVLAVALRVGQRRQLLILLVVVAIASAVPVGATVLTYNQLGTAWQGRYGYPYAMGFVLICGLLIDQYVRRSPRGERWLMLATGATVMTTQLIGQLHVLFQQREGSPLAGSPEWVTPSTALVATLTATGALLIAASLATRAPTPEPSSLRP